MNANDYIQKVSKKFTDDNLKVSKDEINGINIVIGSKSEFRWSWLATKLHIFACVGTKDSIGKKDIDNYSQGCLKYAERNMEGMRGMQHGAVAFAVLASEVVDDEAKEWVQKIPPKHFALVEYPVIYDLKEDKLYFCEKTPLWGYIYFNFFRNFTKLYFR